MTYSDRKKMIENDHKRLVENKKPNTEDLSAEKVAGAEDDEIEAHLIVKTESANYNANIQQYNRHAAWKRACPE